MTAWTTTRVRQVTAGVLLMVAWWACTQAHAQQVPAPAQPASVPGELLVRFAPNLGASKAAAAFSNASLQSVQHFASIDVHRCRVEPGTDVATALRACRANPTILYAEPNYIYHASRTPNDPRFAELWSLESASDSDIDATDAWDKQTGAPGVLVAIIDTGVDYTHQDLAANAWRNPGESGQGRERNGRDDDGNGFIDDVHGWDFAGDDNDPMDDNGHGSHVAGTIAAVGNNAVGVTGINWQASVMACKFLTANGSGNAADAIEAILYAAGNGARVLNNSWGGGGFSQALRDAIEFARQKDALFVAAAGNEGRDNDLLPTYPAGYDVANVVSVAASDRLDQLASFSNRGLRSVDLAAPGAEILSTTPGDTYQAFSGTSMATPHVSGVAALLLAAKPQSTYTDVMVRIAANVDTTGAFAATTASGGRLNAHAALASVGPRVAFVTRLDAAPGIEGPFPVQAQVTGDTTLTAVVLDWSLAGGAVTSVPMTNVSDGLYRGEIPAQSLGVEVEYSVEVADAAGRTWRSRAYSFRVGEPAQIPGCGQFSLPSVRTPQGRVLVVLGNVLLILLGIAAARRILAARHSHTPLHR